MRRVTEWLATLPSTNARIVVTLGVVLGTAVRYWASSSWVPAGEWLAFLAAMSGIDATQFWAKRKTQHTDSNGNPRPTTEMKAQP